MRLDNDMSGYNWIVTITLPAALAEIAAKVGRAMDPDSGGARSFSPVITGYDGEGNPTYNGNIRASTPCREEFALQAAAMLANPALLHAACTARYARDWPDEVPPTLEECEAFCGAVIPEPQPPAADPVV